MGKLIKKPKPGSFSPSYSRFEDEKHIKFIIDLPGLKDTESNKSEKSLIDIDSITATTKAGKMYLKISGIRKKDAKFEDFEKDNNSDSNKSPVT